MKPMEDCRSQTDDPMGKISRAARKVVRKINCRVARYDARKATRQKRRHCSITQVSAKGERGSQLTGRVHDQIRLEDRTPEPRF